MTLPASFESNTLERMVNFLNESNRIEGITAFDYHLARFQSIDGGHFGAFVNSQELALHHAHLSHKNIRHWQSLVTREQLLAGEQIEEHEIGCIRGPNLQKNVRIGPHIPPDFSRVPTLLSHLIEDINAGLKDQEKLKDDAEFAKFLGHSFQKFEWIHPFADGNGRVGRLLANYIATFCGRPIIVFNSELCEKNEYYRAHETAEKMIRFMANKIQEAIFGFGQTLLVRIQQLTGFSAKYRNASSGEEETYEWHSLRSLFTP